MKSPPWYIIKIQSSSFQCPDLSVFSAIIQPHTQNQGTNSDITQSCISFPTESHALDLLMRGDLLNQHKPATKTIAAPAPKHSENPSPTINDVLHNWYYIHPFLGGTQASQPKKQSNECVLFCGHNQNNLQVQGIILFEGDVSGWCGYACL